MKYDPIMCMMVDDSVKAEDAMFVQLKFGSGRTEGAKLEENEYREYAEALLKKYGEKRVTLSKQGKVIVTYTNPNDSKTIDHAIRMCDASTGRKVVVYVENYLRSIGKNNSTGKYDRIVHGVKNLLNESLLEDDKLKNAAEKEAKRLLEKYGM